MPGPAARAEAAEGRARRRAGSASSVIRANRLGATQEVLGELLPDRRDIVGRRRREQEPRPAAGLVGRVLRGSGEPVDLGRVGVPDVGVDASRCSGRRAAPSRRRRAPPALLRRARARRSRGGARRLARPGPSPRRGSRPRPRRPAVRWPRRDRRSAPAPRSGSAAGPCRPDRRLPARRPDPPRRSGLAGRRSPLRRPGRR